MPGSHDTVTSGLTCCATQAAACDRLAAAAGANANANANAGADIDLVPSVSRFPVPATIGAAAATDTSTAVPPSASAQRRLRNRASSPLTRPKTGQHSTQPAAPITGRPSGRPRIHGPDRRISRAGCAAPGARSERSAPPRPR